MTPLEPQLFHALTDDGIRLALHRFHGGERGAVVCCHGLAANRLAFDVSPKASLARHLAGAGFDVFLLELRGHGASERPRKPWSFDTYVERDVPAALRRVRELTAGPVGWVGHSMGGIIALSHLARGGRNLSGVVTVGSTLDYSESSSGFHRLLALRGALRFLPVVPVDLIARRAAPFVGRWPSPYERFNVWSTNVEASHWRRICEEGFHPVSPPVMAQLASAFERGGLRAGDGRCYLEGLAAAGETPVLVLAGSRDAQCPPETAARMRQVCGGRFEVLVLGRDHGCVDDYGHFDLLIGRRAATEVFPHLERFFAEAMRHAA